jgi:hypothetical protein
MTTEQSTEYSSLNAADSAAKLVELSAAYKAAQPAPALHELSPEQAGQRLQDMEKAFNESNKPKNTPADAAIVGDQPPRDGFETVSWPATTVRNKLDTIDTLRSLEIPDKGIAQIIAGEGPYTEADVAWARHMKDVVFNDPEVRARILAGDRAAVRHVIGVNQILIVAGAKE